MYILFIVEGDFCEDLTKIPFVLVKTIEEAELVCDNFYHHGEWRQKVIDYLEKEQVPVNIEKIENNQILKMFGASLRALEKKKEELEINGSLTTEGENELINEIKNLIGLITFQSQTDSYWKDLEDVKTKVMVISIPSGTFIRSAKNNIKEEFSDKEVNGNFLILDGLQYKSNDEYNPIIYMKV